MKLRTLVDIVDRGFLLFGGNIIQFSSSGHGASKPGHRIRGVEIFLEDGTSIQLVPDKKELALREGEIHK